MAADRPDDLDGPIEDPNPPTYYADGWDVAPRRRSRVPLVVGAAVVAAAVVAGGGVLVADRVRTAREQPLPADVTAPVEAWAVQLVTGSCLAELPPDGPVERVRVVPCADEHAAQVIGQYAFAQDAVWPGQEGAHARVARSCTLSDEETAAGVRVVTWAPTEEGWRDGDREGLCLAVPPEG
ncbi:hypothetical protein [Cellulomonas telluris]|uniref:hypothetical protein n=1 Tax=Cellulomonas telluris TaxID=2306636 RepID=UPI00165741F9|nr:hypothetical protein [Cellulomonas telluris]